MKFTSKKTQLEWLSYTTLAFALIIHTINYLLNRSFFQDEASLAFNIVNRNWKGLLGILDFSQSAPIAFLLSTELFVSIMGTSSYVFRLLPFLMAILACFVLFRVAKEIEPRLIPIMIFWYATSSINLRYATEFKQYSSDVFFTLALIFIAIRLHKQAKIKLIVWWTIVSAVAIWFSHASVFVIAGVGITLIFTFLREKKWRFLGMIITGCIIALLSFLVAYLNFYQYTANGTELAKGMQNYWQNDFFELNLVWLIRFPVLIFRFTSGFDQYLTLILIIFGFVIGCWKIPKQYMAILLLPMLMTLIASYFNLYPLRNRFLLFLLPSTMLISSFGLLDVFIKLNYLGKGIQKLTVIAFCALLLTDLSFTTPTTDVKGIFNAIQEINPDTIIYMPNKIGHIANFYSFDYRLIVDETQLADIPITQSTSWLVINSDNFSPSQDYDFLLTREGVVAICRDGTQQFCP